MKRIISSLVFSVALLGTVVAQEAQKPAAKQNKFVALMKKYPKTTAALVATVVTAGGVAITYRLKPEFVNACLTQIAEAAVTAKNFAVTKTGEAGEFIQAHKLAVGGSVAGVTAAGLIATDLARGEKSIIKKTFRNRKAAAQQA